MPINQPYESLAALAGAIPVFPLDGAILLPRAELPLNIFEPRYLAMVETAMAGPRLIGMIQPDETREAGAAGPALYRVGCVGRITQYGETGDGRLLMTLTGVARFRIVTELDTDEPFRICAVDYAPYKGDLEPDEADSGRRQAVESALRRFAAARKIGINWDGVGDTPTEILVNALSIMSPFSSAEKQALVEAPTLAARADALVAMAEMALAGGGEEAGAIARAGRRLQ